MAQEVRMLPDRVNALSRLIVGDIFHAQCPNGASLICLIEAVTDTTIRTRTVTHQIKVEFDRRTGVESDGENEARCVIDSIAPLPVVHHNVILGMDRKLRLEPDLTKHKLDEDEKRALIFIASFYPSNPL
jgi:hypothetical protein